MTSVRNGPFLFVRINEVKLIRYVLDSWKDFQKKIKRQEEKDWTIHVWENFKSKVGTLCYQNLSSTKVHHSMPTHNEMIYFLKLKLEKKSRHSAYSYTLIFSAFSSHRINFSLNKSMTPYPTSDVKSMDTWKQSKPNSFFQLASSSMKLYSDIHWILGWVQILITSNMAENKSRTSKSF